jgi:iron complex transport system ATP-binding protein
MPPAASAAAARAGVPDGSAAPLLEARGLHFRYGASAPVVCGATLRLERGALAALIGSNGSGKSTLIRLLVGILPPERGEVLLDGVPLERVPRRERARKLGYVPQSTTMTFPFTALEVVLTGRAPYAAGIQFESAADQEKSHAALEAVGAAHLSDRRMTELSGGERQLVTVARALAQEPAALLLDEPAAALDLKHRAALVRLLRRLRDEQGLGAIVVTHDLELLDPAFDRVHAMRCGAVVAQGRPSDVLCGEVLQQVYDDAHVRAARIEGRTFVWSES